MKILIMPSLTMVKGSFMIWTLSMAPNWEKYCLRFSSPVCQERPPTNSFTEISEVDQDLVSAGPNERVVTGKMSMSQWERMLKVSGYVKCFVSVKSIKMKVGTSVLLTGQILLLLLDEVLVGLTVDHDERCLTEVPGRQED